MKQYLDLVQHVLDNGVVKPNRTGVDTLSTFGYYYEVDLAKGFPLLTTKRISWKNIVVELLWFISGKRDADFLERHKCHFWRPWYNQDGTVNAAYGPAWRHFGAGNDQLAWAVEQLKTKPLSRAIVVSAWDPDVVQTPPKEGLYWSPCHLLYILNVQHKPNGGQHLCLHLTQRSADIALGVPYNVASYALLLHLFSRFSGIEPGIFGHSLVDAHIYLGEHSHVPKLQEQVQRAPRPLPTLHIDESIQSLEDIEALLHPKVTTKEILSKFVLDGYDPYPRISFEVAV